MKFASGLYLKIKNTIKSLTINEFVILLIVASSFVSVYLISLFILLLPFYFTFTRQYQKALPKTKGDYSLLIFALYAALVTLIQAKDSSINFFELKAIWLKFLGVGIIVLVFDIFFFKNIMTKRALRYGMILASVLSITSFLIAVVQKILHIYPDPILRPGRVASVFINENYYSTVIEFVVIITMYLFFISKGKHRRLLFAFCLMCNIVGLYLSQCRTAYLAVAATIFIFLLLSLKKRHFFIVGSLLLILAAVLLALSQTTEFGFIQRLNPTVIFSDLEFRMGIWNNALHSIQENPLFGRGYYSYGAVMNEIPNGYLFSAIHAHNLFIEIILDFGIVGFIFLCGFCGSLFFKGIKVAIDSKSRAVFSLVLSTAVSILIHGSLDLTIIFPQTGFFAVFLLTSPELYDTKKQVLE